MTDTADSTISPIAAPQLASFLGFQRSPTSEARVPRIMTPNPHRMTMMVAGQSSITSAAVGMGIESISGCISVRGDIKTRDAATVPSRPAVTRMNPTVPTTLRGRTKQDASMSPFYNESGAVGGQGTAEGGGGWPASDTPGSWNEFIAACAGRAA